MLCAPLLTVTRHDAPCVTRQAEGGAGGGVGGSKMRGVAAERRNPINACDGVADKEVAA